MKITRFILIGTVSFFTINSCSAQYENSNNSQSIKKDTMNQLNQLHDANKEVSALLLFKGTEGKVMTLHIQKNGLLKEHITKTEALLVCVTGEAVYEDEKGNKQTLKTGNFIKIEPMVKHWVKGLEDSQLLLIK